jgi:hypothetical protein
MPSEHTIIALARTIASLDEEVGALASKLHVAEEINQQAEHSNEQLRKMRTQAELQSAHWARDLSRAEETAEAANARGAELIGRLGRAAEAMGLDVATNRATNDGNLIVACAAQREQTDRLCKILGVKGGALFNLVNEVEDAIKQLRRMTLSSAADSAPLGEVVKMIDDRLGKRVSVPASWGPLPGTELRRADVINPDNTAHLKLSGGTITMSAPLPPLLKGAIVRVKARDERAIAGWCALMDSLEGARGIVVDLGGKDLPIDQRCVKVVFTDPDLPAEVRKHPWTFVEDNLERTEGHAYGVSAPGIDPLSDQGPRVWKVGDRVRVLRKDDRAAALWCSGMMNELVGKAGAVVELNTEGGNLVRVHFDEHSFEWSFLPDNLAPESA